MERFYQIEGNKGCVNVFVLGEERIHRVDLLKKTRIGLWEKSSLKLYQIFTVSSFRFDTMGR